MRMFNYTPSSDLFLLEGLVTPVTIICNLSTRLLLLAAISGRSRVILPAHDGPLMRQLTDCAPLNKSHLVLQASSLAELFLKPGFPIFQRASPDPAQPSSQPQDGFDAYSDDGG